VAVRPDPEAPPNTVELLVPFVNGYGGAELVIGPVNIPLVDRENAEQDRSMVFVIIVVELMVSVPVTKGLWPVGKGETVTVVVPTTVLL
jgi:hypothetical protein